MATSQVIEERKEQILRLDIIQQTLNRVPIVHYAYWIASHHGETWKDQGARSGAQRLAQVCFDETSWA